MLFNDDEDDGGAGGWVSGILFVCVTGSRVGGRGGAGLDFYRSTKRRTSECRDRFEQKNDLLSIVCVSSALCRVAASSLDWGQTTSTTENPERETVAKGWPERSPSTLTTQVDWRRRQGTSENVLSSSTPARFGRDCQWYLAQKDWENYQHENWKTTRWSNCRRPPARARQRSAPLIVSQWVSSVLVVSSVAVVRRPANEDSGNWSPRWSNWEAEWGNSLETNDRISKCHPEDRWSSRDRVDAKHWPKGNVILLLRRCCRQQTIDYFKVKFLVDLHRSDSDVNLSDLARDDLWLEFRFALLEDDTDECIADETLAFNALPIGFQRRNHRSDIEHHLMIAILSVIGILAVKIFFHVEIPAKAIEAFQSNTIGQQLKEIA